MISSAAPHHIRVSLAFECQDEVLAYLAEVSSFLDDVKAQRIRLSHDLLQELFGAGNGTHPVLDLNFEHGPTGTNHLVVSAKPSDRFKRLMAASRTGYGEGR